MVRHLAVAILALLAPTGFSTPGATLSAPASLIVTCTSFT